MLKKRIIPVILLNNGSVVQSRKFSRYQIIGNPTAAVERISNWESDELIYLDITQNDYFSDGNAWDSKQLIKSIAERCSVPLAYGGGIRHLEDARQCLRLGADKITLNTAAFHNPTLISEIASVFGSQCVVASIDVKMNSNQSYEVFISGREATGLTPEAVAREYEARGVGEILLNAMDRDGSAAGFDIALINQVCDAVRIPVIALGGAGEWQHFAEVLSKTQASAVAAANIFHHTENSVYHCKEYLYRSGFPIRKPHALSSVSSTL